MTPFYFGSAQLYSKLQGGVELFLFFLLYSDIKLANGPQVPIFGHLDFFLTVAQILC